MPKHCIYAFPTSKILFFCRYFEVTFYYYCFLSHNRDNLLNSKGSLCKKFATQYIFMPVVASAIFICKL